MKTFLSIILFGLGFLSACAVPGEPGLIEEQSIEDCYENYDQNQLSFNYPCTWDLLVKEESDYEVFLGFLDPTPPGNSIWLQVQAKSFEEYENANKELIESNLMSIEQGYLEYNGTKYPVRRYGQHGGFLWLIDMNSNYIGITAEFDWNAEKQKEIDFILSSLQFATPQDQF